MKDKSYLASQLSHIIPFVVNVLPFVQDPAGRRFHQTVEVLDQRGFSRAGMTDDTYKLSLFYLKADVFERLLFICGSRAVYIIHMF